MKDKLPPIPIPPAQYWRIFKLRIIPFLVFCSLIFAISILWKQYVLPPTLVGEVQTIRANVTSPYPGSIIDLQVSPLQTVKKGDVVAKVVIDDINTQLSLLRTELDLLRISIDPTIQQRRSEINYSQLYLDWLRERVNLSADRADLIFADAEFKRVEQLYNEKILSRSEFDLAKARKELLESRISQRENLINEIKQHLDEVTTPGLSSSRPASSNLVQLLVDLDAKLHKIESNINPINLVAPIDGTVSMVYRRQGENIKAGEPILTISALKSDLIIGYLRQPFPLDPKPEMPVEVRTRSFQRQVGIGKILSVGSQVEMVSTQLCRPGMAVEFGLPILVSLPPELNVRPGEIVDLVIRSSSLK